MNLYLIKRRIDTTGGTREILRKLHDIETILKDQSSLISKSQKHNEYSPPGNFMQSPSDNTTGTTTEISSNILVSPSWAVAEFQHSSDINVPPLTIPPEHKTSSSYLLGLPQVRSLVGEYPPDLFFRLESRDQLPFGSESDNLLAPQQLCQIDRRYAANLVASFFSSAHQHHPIIDRSEFNDIYSRFIDSGPDSSIESALCMVVLAIGEAAITPADPVSLRDSPPGMRYMQHAMPTLLYQSSWSFSFNLALPQALVLSSVYYAYIVRPLRSGCKYR